MRNWAYTGLLIISVFVLSVTRVSAQRNWLAGSVSEAELASYLKPVDTWREKNKQSVLHHLEQLPDATKAALIKSSTEDLMYKWPNLPATVFLEFYKNGNRSNYQSLRGERRKVLSELVIGELLENKGRFIPQIINGIWAICEESTWAYPAHLYLQKEYTPLPQPGEATLDLGAAGTATLMSWTYLLLKDKLAKTAKVIPERIRYELERRIIEPFMERDDFWWMGFQGQSVNNWNPWVNERVLLTSLLTEEKPDRISHTVYKTMQSVDFFINQYPNDGGCDEGPSYWSMAGGALIHYLQMLKSATGGSINITNHPLICKMGEYIYKLNINKNEFVDFADAHRFTTPDIPSVFAYGTACNNDTLKQFASYFAHRKGNSAEHFLSVKSNLKAFINYLNIYPEIRNIPPKEPLSRLEWLPDLQVLTARSRSGSSDGLFLAAKGGTNGESHNHNDVGNFIIYVNGEPAIVDIGVGTYTRQTFSKDRYKIFTMQSAWHNLPVINGIMQHQGGKFQAKDVQFQKNKNKISLSMDIAGAYPKEAGVKSWIRTITFNGKQVILDEKYALDKFKKPVNLSLMTPLNVTVKDNNILLEDKQDHYGLSIHYDPKKFNVKVEDKPLKDPSLLHSWPRSLKRIQLIVKDKKLKNNYMISFQSL